MSLTSPFRRSRVQAMPVPCMRCGDDRAVPVGTRSGADFDVAKLPEHLRRPFTEGLDGVCLRCGLYQQYHRYRPDELAEYLSVMASKDEAVGEQLYRHYPVPTEFVESFDREVFAQRLQRWDGYFAAHPVGVSRTLFLRPLFGAAPEWAHARFGCAVAGLEISDVSARTTAERVPGFELLEGNIHGELTGPFLDSGPYEAVFVMHTLVHSLDIVETVRRIASLVAPGGFAVFSQEVIRKPHNGFHTVFPSEWQLVDILREAFDHIDRIDDCDPEPGPAIAPNSRLGDSPDLVGWR